MRMTSVRRYLIKKNVGVPEVRIDDTVIIIDGAYLKETYKKSGCQFILGGEYDRYASYLKNILGNFTQKNIECFVVFNGGMKADIEYRKEIHQKVIDRTDAIRPGREDNEFVEPIFVKDVQREVFKELDITYFVCEYDHRQALIALAKQYDFPILTNNFEYSLLGVTCIHANSVIFDVSKGFRCTVYHPDKNLFPLHYDIMSILLAISDEDSSYYKHLPKVLKCHEKNIFVSAQHWIRRQNKTSAIKDLSKHLSLQDKQSLLHTIDVNSKLLRNKQHSIIDTFQNRKHAAVPKTNVINFKHAVSTGRIAIPYINLKNTNTFSGSWLIVDKNKNDAMLVALDIVFYVLGLLTNRKEINISFIGRQFSTSHVWDINTKVESCEALKLFNEQNKRHPNSVDVFKVVIPEILNGFDFTLLDSVSEDSHMIIIALVYYCFKSEEDFSKGVFSILLSYFMLGPVSKQVGILKRSNFSVTHNNEVGGSTENIKREHYVAAAQAFMDFFYINESKLKDLFYRDLLHRIAEFEHCLQHVNYLNKLCGENTKCTTYHKAINTTFIYNVLIALKDQESPLDYLKLRMNCHQIFLDYKKIVDVFEKCFKSVQAQ